MAITRRNKRRAKKSRRVYKKKRGGIGTPTSRMSVMELQQEYPNLPLNPIQTAEKKSQQRSLRRSNARKLSTLERHLNPPGSRTANTHDD